ncbi:uncharacterized protein ARMOST_11278 [Armillaria ostoyae]|uniref:Uncharacterized protein n=1 Tax=Armillaria ostoyae TaxID=47428 RepID=A0A284RGP2_ARMOS|nr:uncharacterized protein ARMOST_11278 [Armillaria ostoyae]
MLHTGIFYDQDTRNLPSECRRKTTQDSVWPSQLSQGWAQLYQRQPHSCRNYEPAYSSACPSHAAIPVTGSWIKKSMTRMSNSTVVLADSAIYNIAHDRVSTSRPHFLA